MSILVVDDREDNRYLLESLLRGNGYEVISTANGEEAIEALRSGGIELIVSDILMPVMDGFQLCRKVKTDEATKGIPFIVYTATYTGPQDEAFALKIGADRFLIKPCEPDVFIQVVNEVLATTRSPHDAPAAETGAEAEAEIFKLYSERLVRKLEQKMLQAEHEIQVRLEAEKALRESESRFRLFAETAPVGILISDPQETVLYVSPKFVELFGYGIKDIPTLDHWWRLAFPDEAAGKQVRREWRAAVDEARVNRSEIVPMECIVTCKDRNFRHIEFRMAATHEIDVVVFTDITDRKRAEEEQAKLQAQLLQAQKLESIGRLAGGVAHDYNNMLNIIIGYSELALMATQPDNPLHKNLTQILEAGKRSADITRQLLAFARQQPISPRVLDLNQVVNSMLKMLRRLMGEDIELVWCPHAALWPLRMDPSQIDQILVNLCVNARDAVAGVGKIVIETENISFDQAFCPNPTECYSGDYVMLTVSDNGCGMDRETQNKIFDPFFTTKEPGKGTGLGLATVYGIVRQNNGFINLYTEVDQGSTFRIYFPRHLETTRPAASEDSPEFPRGFGEKVLVVEDEPAILSLMAQMLTELGYSVLHAATPESALDRAREHGTTIDLLISDVIMPGMNGRELARHVRSLCPQVCILFMSGHTADIVSRQGVLEQGVNFIQKPFSLQTLAVKIREALNSLAKESRHV